MSLARPARFLILLSCALGLPAAASAQAVHADDLRYPPLPKFEIPRPERVVLDNGLVVMLLEDHELPLVEVTAVIRAGGRLDPADKIGLAKLGAQVLRNGGSETLPGDQLDDWLDGRGAVIEANADGDVARAVLSSLTRDFPDSLRVFADVLRRPAFDAGKLEVARNQAIGFLSRQNDESEEVLFREFRKLVYGADSPYARTETYATLGAIRRDDLVAWHRQAFHPDRMVLGLVGDFRTGDALALLRAAFGDWPRGPQGALPEATWKQQASPGVYWAEKKDVTQSNIVLGHLGVRKDDPDYYALEILNNVLSGAFSSRLISHLRSQKGLAYTVFGQVGSDWDHPGMTLLFVATKTQTTGAAIQALLDDARAVQTTQPPTEEEVAKARQSLLNSFIFNADTPRRVMSQQLSLEVYGYPLDWLSRYRAGLEAVTPAQVREAAVRHLHPDDFSILVVGTSEGRDRPLTDFGKVTMVDMTMPARPARK
ncbi:MAG TPA: pitrilysin family protein [Thermoanaerobaculia bacterium]|jgi:zinc protease|nr:pitrilysin family protein [Thermoanaerobaculia bacterium]